MTLLHTRAPRMRALMLGTVLLNAAMAAASAVSTIAAADWLGAAWAGLPNTAGIIGTGIGALLLARVMGRRGRRAGLVLAYLAAAGGGGIAAFAAVRADAAGLVLGLLLLGLGNAGAQLSRYAAAELYPPDRRGTAIGALVWAATAGAVGGPLLLAPTGQLAARLGGTPLVGPFVMAAFAGGAAAWVATSMPRPPGLTAPGGGTATSIDADAGGGSVRRWLRAPTTRGAFAVMATAHAVMVIVMTATPLDMHRHGAGLGAVGAVLSAHTLGMFVLSPVTGRLLDRFGARPVMLAGLATVALAAALAAAPTVPRAAALFLLGYGWNLCFIGGSGQLARDLPEGQRAEVEGSVDAGVWGIAAVASLVSTALLSAGGYAFLAGAAGALVLVPAALFVRGSR